MNIGDRLKIARESIGYTQAKASEESRIGTSSISEFESSKREPSFSQLSKLAEIYRKSIDFFFSETLLVNGVMLWRNEPHNEEVKKETEAMFYQLCEQYHRLELCTNEINNKNLPGSDVVKPEEFDYRTATILARKVQKDFSLGEVPIASLKRILEEVYFIKIFYLDFLGSSISTVSEQFGTAILLNIRNKQWRRSFDLAHELFHILTWNIFRLQDMSSVVASEMEEKYADAFASELLMPRNPFEMKIEEKIDEQGEISMDQLDDIAREYDVSLDAVIYRMANVFKIKKGDVNKFHDIAKDYAKRLKPRKSYQPQKFPERYCDLAIRALREGNLSLMQFSKYMEVSYKKAQDYLMEDEGFKDEKISISVA